MENAVIKTGVNVNLDHNDMVELMLEEQKEQREVKQEAINTQIAAKKKKFDDLQEKLKELAIESCGVKKSAEYKKFLAGVKAMGLEVEEECYMRYTNGEKLAESYVRYNLGAYETYKNPMTQLRKDIRNQKVGRCHHNEIHCIISVPSSINANFKAHTEDGKVSIGFCGERDLKIKFNTKGKTIIKKLETLAVELFKLQKEDYELELEMFTLEHDGVRSKSKFIKGMLQNSDTGKELVTLMENIKSSNLISIGSKG